MHIAKIITVIGRVQGVGFRPFIFQIAEELTIKGTVQNNLDGVYIHAEGSIENLSKFQESITFKAPRLSRILKVTAKDTEYNGFTTFDIIASSNEGNSQIVIPIDAAVCDDCVEEMKNPGDFRYNYSFINCTQCGPRYTIIKDLPYDRPFTTMSDFPMCSSCREEYEDVRNRRHHAQPIACPTCGPQLTLLSKNGSLIVTEDCLGETRRLLKQGNIIAIKGIGGFHLCCDATNEATVQLLRERKKRPDKPLAIMCSSVSKILEIAIVTEKEEKILKSPEAPIVILKQSASYDLAPSVAKKLSTIGVMLPYAPLHYLLVDDIDLPYIVATSANISGQPLIYENVEALTELSNIVDYFLVHNRDILRPIDDSVVQVSDGDLEFFRRARGYVPDPIITSEKVHNLIALGSIQKNTFTLGRNDQLFIGPHIGDLTNYETLQYDKKILRQLMQWVTFSNPIVVQEKHPSFPVEILLEDLQVEKMIEVQHHHAHMAGCMVENEVKEAWGVILDGTGFGDDGAIWGFELMYGTPSKYERKGHLAYWNLIGGDKAIREPWRNTVTLFFHLFNEKAISILEEMYPSKLNDIRLLKSAFDWKMNSSQVGTCGRLFDAVSSLLGVCHVSTYDGQAAIELAEIIDEEKIYNSYPFEITGMDLLEIQLHRWLEAILLDIQNEIEVKEIAGRFHETVVQAIVQLIRKAHELHPHFKNKIVFSGGSMHNRYLKKRVRQEFTKLNYEVYFHKEVPCSDGGLSYGQMMVAANLRN